MKKKFDFDISLGNQAHKKSICVFCSSSEALDPVFYSVAGEFGKLIAENDFNLVHGGGMIGLMGVISDAVQKYGGKVTGVLPEQLNLEGIASETDDEIIITKDMADRKTEMRKRSDAFVALPGGFGTLEEILEVITLKQLKYHTKPVVIINTNDFYGPLLQMFDRLFEQSFAKPDYANLYFIATTPEEAMNYILHYEYEEVKDKWFFR
jgi:cytokinin riboside 5'-monophosphate phosphoribohydrolase